MICASEGGRDTQRRHGDGRQEKKTMCVTYL